ncbi:uncharacterized protein LOC144717091 [Wolffia australiana]
MKILAVDHLRYLTMLALWMAIWMLRILLDFLPISAGDLSSRAPFGDLVLRGGFGNVAFKPASRAIGRALCQALSLINDVPSSTRKYDFVMNTAERILDENTVAGEAVLHQINREALAMAFSRSCDRLRHTLQASHAPWPVRVLRQLPLGSLLAAYFSALASLLTTVELHHSMADTKIESPESEKLSQELLWIANKMRSCGALDEAFLRWCYAGELSSLSLTAHPRVQGPLVKISALIFKEMNKKGGRVPREVRFRVMALWVPLLCHAGNCVGCPVLSGWEKRDVERVLGELIQEMTWEDQELILGRWMEDFAFSSSDWPDLRSCYDLWCCSSRKLLLE